MTPPDPLPRDRGFFQTRFLGRDATVLGAMQFGLSFLAVNALVGGEPFPILIFAAMIGATTLGLGHVLGRIARGKGYPPEWRWFCLLGLIGVLVVRLLPDRARHGPPRGFPLDPPAGPGR